MFIRYFYCLYKKPKLLYFNFLLNKNSNNLFIYFKLLIIKFILNLNKLFNKILNKIHF